MSLMQRLQDSNEVLAAVITVGLGVVIALISRVLRPRGRVKWAITHQYTFLTHPNPPPPPPTQQPATLPQPVQPAQPLLVHTRTIWVQNVGRAPVENVEVIFNYAPQHFEVWPQRQYTQINNPAGNLAITFNGLNRREWATITMLNVAFNLPMVTNVRWNGGTAPNQTTMAPQEVLSRWLRWLIWGFFLSGIVLWVYAIVRSILFVIGS